MYQMKTGDTKYINSTKVYWVRLKEEYTWSAQVQMYSTVTTGGGVTSVVITKD